MFAMTQHCTKLRKIEWDLKRRGIHSAHFQSCRGARCAPKKHCHGAHRQVKKKTAKKGFRCIGKDFSASSWLEFQSEQ